MAVSCNWYYVFPTRGHIISPLAGWLTDSTLLWGLGTFGALEGGPPEPQWVIAAAVASEPGATCTGPREGGRGRGGRGGGINKVGVYIGMKKRKNGRQSPNIVNKASTKAS